MYLLVCCFIVDAGGATYRTGADATLSAESSRLSGLCGRTTQLLLQACQVSASDQECGGGGSQAGDGVGVRVGASHQVGEGGRMRRSVSGFSAACSCEYPRWCRLVSNRDYIDDDVFEITSEDPSHCCCRPKKRVVRWGRVDLSNVARSSRRRSPPRRTR